MWSSEKELDSLPKKNGFRLRGEEMTRLETFSDAAFAFAMTLQVISSGIPKNYTELITAIKGIPAFAASFAQIMLFWAGHRRWSRRYGLEDTRATLLSLGLILVMLVYVYPLKLIFTTLFSWITGGWLPSTFAITAYMELTGLFVIYGVGFGALSGTLSLLYAHASASAERLVLNSDERFYTNADKVSWAVQASTGFASAAFALLMPTHIGIYAGFFYATLPVTMPLLGKHYKRKSPAQKNSQ